MARGTVLQWMVARALCEGAPTTKGRVAALMGVDVSTLHARSTAEGWNALDWRLGALQALQRQIVVANAAAIAAAPDDARGPGEDLAGVGRGDEAAAVAGGERTGSVDDVEGTAGVDGVEGTARGAGVEGIDPPDRARDAAAFAASATSARTAASDRPSPPDGADPVAVLAAASAFVVRQVAALIDGAERMDGRLDREQIDGLFAFGRMMERWEALARERVQEEETTSDEDLARYVRDVNERIVELAALEARRLLAAGFRPPDDA